MSGTSKENVLIFIIICSFLILLLVAFITIVIYRYQQKQNIYFKSLEQLKIIHNNEILQSQLEIQEQTFQNISRELHDNIGQKLTLAKLYLNTLPLGKPEQLVKQVESCIQMIGESIIDLSDISRSMNSEILLNNGLIPALEFEVAQMEKTGAYKINLFVSGDLIFLDTKRELILFRIVQEALTNIIKHASANIIKICIDYAPNFVSLLISDNGKGFISNTRQKKGIGLINMDKRAKLLNGKCEIESNQTDGTTIKIQLPLYDKEKML